MNDDAWSRFLRQLVAQTEAGRAKWRRSDRRGTYVLSRPSGSVTVSKGDPIALTGVYSVELSDPDGKELDRLMINTFDFLGTVNVDVRNLVDRVISLIEEQDTRANDVANSIIAEIVAEPDTE